MTVTAAGISTEGRTNRLSRKLSLPRPKTLTTLRTQYSFELLTVKSGPVRLLKLGVLGFEVAVVSCRLSVFGQRRTAESRIQMAIKKKLRKKSKTKRGVQLLGASEKKSLQRVKKDLLKCVSSIDKTLKPYTPSLSEKQVAERMARSWERKRKAKGWVAGNSPNLIPDFAK